MRPLQMMLLMVPLLLATPLLQGAQETHPQLVFAEVLPRAVGLHLRQR